MKQEIEVKFKLADPSDSELIIQKIEGVGAEYEGKVSQLDIWFDSPDPRFKELRAGLRLRREGARTTLTLKYEKSADEKFRRAQEIEFGIDDFDQAIAFLRQLGFQEDYRLKKERETWRVGGVKILLDVVEGLGTFLELEGTEEEMDKVIKELGLATATRITKHYGKLFKERVPASQ